MLWGHPLAATAAAAAAVASMVALAGCVSVSWAQGNWPDLPLTQKVESHNDDKNNNSSSSSLNMISCLINLEPAADHRLVAARHRLLRGVYIVGLQPGWRQRQQQETPSSSSSSSSGGRSSCRCLRTSSTCCCSCSPSCARLGSRGRLPVQLGSWGPWPAVLQCCCCCGCSLMPERDRLQVGR